MNHCPECGEETTTVKNRMRSPSNFGMSIGICIRHCTHCLWTERDPDEQNSLTRPSRRLSETVKQVDISDYLSPFHNNNQPVFLEMAASSKLYLAVFSTKAKLDLFIRDYPIPYEKIISITDGPEFIDSLPGHITIVVDPYRHSNGAMRYLEIFR